MEVLHQRPESSSFVPLAEHQSRTPHSFYDSPPVLHHLSERCKVVTSESELRACPALAGLRGGGSALAAAEEEGQASTDSRGGDNDRDVVIDDVDVWVTSEKLILFSRGPATGVSIPYPSISLHAIQRLPMSTISSSSTPSESVKGLYMQLAMAENADETGDDEDVEEETVSLTILPQHSPDTAQPTEVETAAAAAAAAAASPSSPEQAPETQATAPQDATESLFAALSACSNLHPDAGINDGDGEDDYNDNEGAGGQGLFNDSILAQNGLIFPGNNSSGGGGLPPPMPGSGGWITAENVHEYFDEEGNWKGDGEGEFEDGDDGDEGGGPLGPGAGTVRPREARDGETDGADDAGAGAGAGANGAEEDETKWRRTG